MLPNNVGVADVHVTEASNLGNCDVLIGMDIITLGDFTITQDNGCTIFSFRFPASEKYIDFVEETNRLNDEFKRKQYQKLTRQQPRRKKRR